MSRSRSIFPDAPSNFVRVLDKMMAHKPHERFSSAAEVAEALQGLIRPKAKSIGAAPAPWRRGADLRQDGSADAKAAVEAGTPAPVPPPTIVEVQPRYPAWFAPLARFVEQRPRSALAGAILTVALTFVAGLVLGLALK